MFAKVFSQIFDSSIAEDYNCRRMFIDLLILADSSGVVDMTPEAISRRTNVPVEQVHKYLNELSQPDPLSRSGLEEGRRIILIDSHRNWGWRIVNYEHYRNIRDEEARRTYFRDYQRKRRKSKNVKDSFLTDFDSLENTASASSSTSVPDVLQTPLFYETWNRWVKHRQEIKKPITKTSCSSQLQKLAQMGEPRAVQALEHTMAQGWQGIREPEQPRKGEQQQITPHQRQARINKLNEKKQELYRRFPDPQNLPSTAEKELARIDAELQSL